MQPLKFGVVGVGGYGRVVIKQLLQHPEHARVAAVCDVSAEALRRYADLIAEAGARVMDSFDALLASDIEAVWLPLPIDLHRPFTEAALAAGKAVMVEKPAAGCVQDVDAMIAARNLANKPVAIGFQHIFSTAAIGVKRRLMQGAIGDVRRVTVTGCWPRGRNYYGRAGWPGAIQRKGTWVLDSPANNAMCHFINLALFLIGGSEWDSAQTSSVEAELYRASPIENYDTCSIRARTETGAEVLVLMTHACARRIDPVVRIEGTRGVVTWQEGTAAIIGSGDREERFESLGRAGVVEKLAAYLRGSAIDGVVATLEMARAQTVLVNAASEASAIMPIPPQEISTVQANTWADEYDTVQAIAGIERVLERCAAEGQMIHESGQAAWSRPPGRMGTRGYREFRGPRR